MSVDIKDGTISGQYAYQVRLADGGKAPATVTFSGTIDGTGDAKITAIARKADQTEDFHQTLIRSVATATEIRLAGPMLGQGDARLRDCTLTLRVVAPAEQQFARTVPTTTPPPSPNPSPSQPPLSLPEVPHYNVGSKAPVPAPVISPPDTSMVDQQRPLKAIVAKGMPILLDEMQAATRDSSALNAPTFAELFSATGDPGIDYLHLRAFCFGSIILDAADIRIMQAQLSNPSSTNEAFLSFTTPFLIRTLIDIDKYSKNDGDLKRYTHEFAVIEAQVAKYRKTLAADLKDKKQMCLRFDVNETELMHQLYP